MKFAEGWDRLIARRTDAMMISHGPEREAVPSEQECAVNGQRSISFFWL
jgi:hypothetical protein